MYHTKNIQMSAHKKVWRVNVESVLCDLGPMSRQDTDIHKVAPHFHTRVNFKQYPPGKSVIVFISE